MELSSRDYCKGKRNYHSDFMLDSTNDVHLRDALWLCKEITCCDFMIWHCDFISNDFASRILSYNINKIGSNFDVGVIYDLHIWYMYKLLLRVNGFVIIIIFNEKIFYAF